MDVIIIIMISEVYSDIAKINRELIGKYWPDCPYPIIYCGDTDYNIYGERYYEFKNDVSLPIRIRKIIEIEKPKYAICLLGDAFVTDRVNSDKVKLLIDRLQKDDIDYCNLLIRKKANNKEPFYMIKDEAYPFSFVCYIASQRFIINNYVDSISDLELEDKFMQLDDKMSFSFVRLQEDIFHIQHGIVKGKWIRKTKRELDKKSINALNNKRSRLSMLETLHLMIADMAIRKLTREQYVALHKRMKGK